MFSGEEILLALCLTLVIFVGILYVCCTELGTREKNRFRHTSFIIREKELDEVRASNPDKDLPNGNAEVHELYKTNSIGDDYYSGKNTLAAGQKKQEDQTHLLANMAEGDVEFHAGMAKPRVFGDTDRVVGNLAHRLD